MAGNNKLISTDTRRVFSRIVRQPEREEHSPVGMTATEKFICVTVLVCSAALNYQPVYNSFGNYIVVALSLVSFLTPISGMFFLAASQMLPDPAGLPFSSSQMAVLGFAVHTVLANKWRHLVAAIPFIMAIAPFAIWVVMLLVFQGGMRQIMLLIYAVVTAVAAASLVSQSGGRTTLCLGLFAAGFALCGVTFWGIKFGISGMVQAFDTAVYGETTSESLRVGSARGNAGMLGPPMAISLIGLFGVALALMQNLKKPFFSSCILLVASLAFGLPPLIGSGVRAGLIALAAGFLVWFLCGGFFFNRNPAAAWAMWAGIGLSVLVVAAAWYSLGLDRYWEGTAERQAAQGGYNNPLSGRTLEWKAGWESVLSSPIIGTGGKPVVRYSYGEHPELWASHNTYLDAGMLGGLPALLCYLYFLSVPLGCLWSRRADGSCLALLATYVSACVAIAGNSALQMKHVWILWPLAMSAAVRHGAPVVPRTVRTKRRGYRATTKSSEAKSGPL